MLPLKRGLILTHISIVLEAYLILNYHGAGRVVNHKK